MVVSAIGAVGAAIFIILMNFGLHLLWPVPPGPEPFTGSWMIVVIMTVTGFVVGLIHRFARAEELDAFMGIIKGHMKTRPVPAALLVALVSLSGGFSLGPEVSTGDGWRGSSDMAVRTAWTIRRVKTN